MFTSTTTSLDSGVTGRGVKDASFIQAQNESILLNDDPLIARGEKENNYLQHCCKGGVREMDHVKNSAKVCNGEVDIYI